MNNSLSLIASEGNFHWKAESDQAGPYYIGWTHAMFNYRGFGTRGLGSVSRQGSASQKEAFRMSQAAFACCRHYVQVLCSGMRPDADHAAIAIRVAAKAARDEYARWSHQFGVYSKTDDGYLHAVLDRFEEAVKAEVLSEV